MATLARDVMRPVDGCMRQNHAQDVMEVMDAFDLAFMPLVDEFGGGTVRGAVTRSKLAQVIRRFGRDARVIQVRPVMLPNIPADAPVAQMPGAAARAPAYVVTERGGRLVGVYEPPAAISAIGVRS